MNGHGKSDSPVVPAKSPNKGGLEPSASYGGPQTGTKGETPDTAKGEPKAKEEAREPSAEGMEGRGRAEGNLSEQNVFRTRSRDEHAQGLERVGEVARRDKEVRFTTLLHHVTTWRHSGGPTSGSSGKPHRGWTGDVAGVRGATGGEPRGPLPAPEARRVPSEARTAGATYPKADGRQRPLGITALEDKVVQRAVVEVLERHLRGGLPRLLLRVPAGAQPPRRAWTRWRSGSRTKKVNWVLDADIRDFFATIDHEWLVRFIEHRIADRRVLRLIQKWLRAGVLEDGRDGHGGAGDARKGAVVSPLLANIYLHYVFDLWARRVAAAGHGRRGHRALSPTTSWWASNTSGSQAVPGRASGAVREVRSGTAPREDPADRVLAACGRRERQTRTDWASRRRSTSWASRTSVGGPGRGGSGCCGNVCASGCRQAAARSRTSSSDAARPCPGGRGRGCAG